MKSKMKRKPEIEASSDSMRPIGIIGGMGPQASADLYQKINTLAVRKFAAQDVTDFPNLLISSLPVTDFLANPEKAQEVLSMLQTAVIGFQKFGATSFVIACNTAHLLADDLLREVDLPLISMIDEVVDKALTSANNKVGLLASPTTIKTRLYQDKLEKLGLEVVLPQNSQLPIIEKIIRGVIAQSLTELDKQRFIKIMVDLFQRGAEVIILGCTELPLVIDPTQFGDRVLSSTDILAEKIVDIYYGR